MNPSAFVELIHKKKKFYCINFFDFLDRIEMSESSYKRRKKDPGKFTLAEAERIMNVLQFTEEERKEVFCK